MGRKQITEMSVDEIENLQTLGLDDTFGFNCKSCGKCCIERHDILLTPYDVYRIASYLSRTPQQIIDRYCEVYQGKESHMPIVRVLPVPPDNRCPFLLKRKCSIHAKKPVLCRVYPLAKINTESGTGYYLNGGHCTNEPKPVTVREWIGDIASEEAEQAGELWTKVLFELFPIVQKVKNITTEKARDAVLTAVFVALYIAYDMKEPFAPQLRENFDKLKAMFNGIEDLLAKEAVSVPKES